MCQVQNPEGRKKSPGHKEKKNTVPNDWFGERERPGYWHVGERLMEVREGVQGPSGVFALRNTGPEREQDKEPNRGKERGRSYANPTPNQTLPGGGGE